MLKRVYGAKREGKIKCFAKKFLLIEKVTDLSHYFIKSQ